jgi:aspartyl-tRNA(Asn)/glutamyl-tRNA(Gln) amidotransferase subunit C
MADRPTIDRAHVEHVARLASLSLEPAEVDTMVSELGRIVAYVEKLGELDTGDIPPTTGGYPPNPRATGLSSATALRADEVRPCLSHAEALDQAPRAASGGFAVPRFLDAPRTGR